MPTGAWTSFSSMRPGTAEVSPVTGEELDNDFGLRVCATKVEHPSDGLEHLADETAGIGSLEERALASAESEASWSDRRRFDSPVRRRVADSGWFC